MLSVLKTINITVIFRVYIDQVNVTFLKTLPHDITLTGDFMPYKTVRARQKPVKKISAFRVHAARPSR